ncbi:MAG: hypothetical protein JRI70_04535 [Deltaproteobacteria bacterium]|nr:hypothetical protein [Deltaproteobacteria bacterium]
MLSTTATLAHSAHPLPIPLTRISEIASDIAYRVLMDDAELRKEIIRKYSIRSPQRQLEIDLKKGYEKVIAD